MKSRGKVRRRRRLQARRFRVEKEERKVLLALRPRPPVQVELVRPAPMSFPPLPLAPARLPDLP